LFLKVEPKWKNRRIENRTLRYLTPRAAGCGLIVRLGWGWPEAFFCAHGGMLRTSNCPTPNTSISSLSSSRRLTRPHHVPSE